MYCHIHHCHYHHCNCVPTDSKEKGGALTQEELLALTQEMKQELKDYTVDLKDQIFSYIDIGVNPVEINNSINSLRERDTYILRTLTNKIDELNNTTNLSMFNLRTRVTDLEGQGATFISDLVDSNQRIDELETNKQVLESVTDLSTIKNPKDGLRVYVKSYHAGLGKGGGYFTYDSSKSSVNDGGSVINGWVREYDNHLNTDDFGLAKRDDDVTAKLELMQSLVNNITVNAGEYRVNNFKPNKHFTFEDGAVLLTNAVNGSNGVLPQTGCTLVKPTIRHNISDASVPDGDAANAIKLGTYRQPNDELVGYHDIELIEPVIYLESKTVEAAGIIILGNTYDLTITKPKIIGRGFGIVAHWGGDVDNSAHYSQVTYSYHPHDVTITSPVFEGLKDNNMKTALLLSAVYNFKITDLSAKYAQNSVYVSVGDVYNQVAVPRDKDSIMTNININGVRIRDYVKGGNPVLVSGQSATVRTAVGATVAISDDQFMSVVVDGIDIKTISDSDTTSMIKASLCKNTVIKGQVSGLHGGYLADLDMSKDCYFDISGKSKKPYKVRGNHDCVVKVNSKYNADPDDISARGVELQNLSISIRNPLSSSDGGSISFSVPYPTFIYRGSMILKNNKVVGFINETRVLKGNELVRIATTSLTESIASSDTVSLVRTNKGTVITGSVSGYFNNVYATSPCGFELALIGDVAANSNVWFDGDYLYNVNITGCRFSNVALNNNNASTDITIKTPLINGLSIKECDFDTEAANNRALQRINVSTDNYANFEIVGNKGTVCTSGIPVNIKPSNIDAYKNQAQVYGNSFDDINTTIATAFTGQYVGNNYQGFVRTEPPTTGYWRLGDRLYKESVKVGSTVGWVCTLGGIEPVWTPLPNL